MLIYFSKSKWQEVYSVEKTHVKSAFSDFAQELTCYAKDNPAYPDGRAFQLRIHKDVLKAWRGTDVYVAVCNLIRERMENAHIVSVDTGSERAEYVTAIFAPNMCARYIRHIKMGTQEYNTIADVQNAVNAQWQALETDEVQTRRVTVYFRTQRAPITLVVLLSKTRDVPNVELLLFGRGVY